MPLPDLESPALNPAQFLRRLLAGAFCVVLALTLLLLNLGQTLSVVLIPFSRRAFRSVNRWAANFFWGACARTARVAHGVEVRVVGDELPAAEDAIVIVNHQGMADIPVLLDFALGSGRLGDLKWFVKDIIKWIPGVGWGMLFLDCIFLARDWAADQDAIRRTFHRLVDARVPCWVVSFVEGTRLRPHKLERSREYAEKLGYRPTQHLLLPRTKGFVASVEGLRDHVAAVYDCTIAYVGGVPTLWQWTQGLMPLVHVDVRRIPIADLPREGEAVADWLRGRWQRKDEILSFYYQQGHFPVG